eukprot:3281268-Pyramimonas_sp.AAC.1
MKAPIISSKCAMTAVPNCSSPKLGKIQSPMVSSGVGRDQTSGDCGPRPACNRAACNAAIGPRTSFPR